MTGPGGVDMLVPSVGLIIPPPNPLAVDLSSKYVVQVPAGQGVRTGGESAADPGTNTQTHHSTLPCPPPKWDPVKVPLPCLAVLCGRYCTYHRRMKKNI